LALLVRPIAPSHGELKQQDPLTHSLTLHSLSLSLVHPPTFSTHPSKEKQGEGKEKRRLEITTNEKTMEIK
jgi:hypothetical protein